MTNHEDEAQKKLNKLLDMLKNNYEEMVLHAHLLYPVMKCFLERGQNTNILLDDGGCIIVEVDHWAACISIEDEFYVVDDPLGTFGRKCRNQRQSAPEDHANHRRMELMNEMEIT